MSDSPRQPYLAQDEGVTRIYTDVNSSVLGRSFCLTVRHRMPHRCHSLGACAGQELAELARIEMRQSGG
ncbi:MAG: hypothetical protein ACK2U1_25700 [Anaerolineales bacterium]